MESEQGEMKKNLKGATIRFRRVKAKVNFWGNRQVQTEQVFIPAWKCLQKF